MPQVTPQSTSRRRQAAFSLLEVIVGLAVILIIAAVALPTLTGYLDQKNTETAAAQLTTISTALTNFEKAVGRNPQRLSQLSNVILKSSALSLDSCGAQYTKAGDITSWEGSGPFVNYNIDRNIGLVTPIGVARDTITRLPFSATAGLKRINFLDGVETRYAELLDMYVDAGNGPGSGTVQWTVIGGGLSTLFYFMPISNKC
jgi:prepilin-type N-terminal cleavage/methylation domain-containing protein